MLFVFCHELLYYCGEGINVFYNNVNCSDNWYNGYDDAYVSELCFVGAFCAFPSTT